MCVCVWFFFFFKVVVVVYLHTNVTFCVALFKLEVTFSMIILNGSLSGDQAMPHLSLSEKNMFD
jgi:hypothetical protein